MRKWFHWVSISFISILHWNAEGRLDFFPCDLCMFIKFSWRIINGLNFFFFLYIFISFPHFLEFALVKFFQTSQSCGNCFETHFNTRLFRWFCSLMFFIIKQNYLCNRIFVKRELKWYNLRLELYKLSK